MVEIWAIPIWNGHCAGTHCSVQPENSVIRVQGILKPTYAHTGKFEQILCYRCDVVRMVHENHDAVLSGLRVEWSSFAKTTSKHANTRQNTHVSCGTSRQCAASSWAVTKARYGQ